MSQNPFDALGGGGLDLNALMQQAQQMQEQIADAQNRLAETTVEGTVAGGAVTVSVNGVGDLVAVDVKAGEFDGTDPDDLDDLGAVIVAAYRDAKGKVEDLTNETMGPLAGGLPSGLPGMPTDQGHGDQDQGGQRGSGGQGGSPFLGF